MWLYVVYVFFVYGSSVVLVLIVLCFFFFKQKTAYEMRISDWSSDVCSSDLRRDALVGRRRRVSYIDPIDLRYRRYEPMPKMVTQAVMFCLMKIGRASCRERVCQYV